MVDRFRLNYLKSTGLEKPDVDVSFSSRQTKTLGIPSSPSSELNIPKTFSGEAILKQVKADLKNPDSKVRMLAIRYYLDKNVQSIPMALLQEILSDRDPYVRAEALRSLIQFKSRAISSLFKKYLKDGDPVVRIAALRGMFQYEEKIDLNLFLQFLSDDSPWVRRKVATLLGWAQLEGALPILMELSKDPDAMVRKAALTSLTARYPEESEDRLMEVISDSDPALRNWAKITLEKMLDRPVKKKKIFIENQAEG